MNDNVLPFCTAAQQEGHALVASDGIVLPFPEEDRYFGLSPRIFRWREISEFENMLAKAAQNSHLARRLYAEYYRHLNPEYYKKGEEAARKEFELHKDDFIGQDFDHIYVDMVYCLHRYGFKFQDYCIYQLHKKSEIARKEFVSDKLRYYYCDILNAPEVLDIMTDKWKSYEAYRPFYNRDIVKIDAMADKGKFLQFAILHPRFIYKPLCDHSGHGIHIVKLNNTEDASVWYDEMAQHGSGVAEELVVQGDDMNRLNPGALNTCRVMSFRIGDKVRIPFAALRVGVGDAVTDNAGSGGIYAAVDPETGICISDARNYVNKHFKYHPTTGCPILGFQLPEWNKARQLVNQMATHRFGTTFISWAIAYGKDGWCMVEANDNGDWSLVQSNLEIGRKKDLYALMDQYFRVQSSRNKSTKTE